MSTIHAAKGGEREKVCILLDLTKSAVQQGEEHPDDLNRLLYTGITRTKKELHIVDPKDFERSFTL